MRDLVTGLEGDIVDAQRDAPTRWERYRLRLVNAAEVFRHERELETIARVVAALICFVLSGAMADGQATATLVWDYDAPQAEVSSYVQTAAVDGALVTGAISCAPKTGAATQTTCSAPLAPLAPGKHAIEITATRNGSTATTRVTNFDPTNGPKTSTAPRYNLTFTLSLP